MSRFINYHTQAPFVSFLLALILGIGITYFIPASIFTYRLILIACLLLIACFFGLAIGTKWKVRYLYGPAFIIFFSILICFGALLNWKSNPVIDHRHFSHYQSDHLLGFVSGEPKVKGEIISTEMTINYVKIKDEYKPVRGKLLLKIKTKERDLLLHYGDELRILSNFKRLRQPYNPHEFDYAVYMSHRGIWHETFLTSDALSKTGRKTGNPLIGYALETRKKMVEKFNRYFRSKESAALLATLVLGYRASLEKELVKVFSATGTIHILAVSGMHVGIVFALFAFCLQWMNKGGWLRYIRLLLLLLFIWAYALLTGFAPSVLRAAFMISIFIIGNTLRRAGNGYNNLAASAFFLLLYNPGFLRDVGFQLSYLAVLGIIWLMPLLSALVRFKYELANKGWSYVSMCCAAQLANFPLVLYYFHLFPVYFLPANLFITLPVSLIIYAGFLLLMLPLNKFTYGMADILEQFVLFVNRVLVRIEQWPLATVKSIWLTSYEYLMLYLVMITLVLAFQFSRKQLFYVSVISILVLGLIVNQQLWSKHNSNRLIIFNVNDQMAIGLINGAKPILYSNADSIQQAFIQYSVIPALEAYSSIQYLSFIKEPVKFHLNDISITNNHLQFMEKQLLILDGRKNHPIATAPDWLLVRNNPKRPLDSLLDTLKKSTLLILDGSNSRHTIDRWRADAERLNIEFYCLKDNFAYVWGAK